MEYTLFRPPILSNWMRYIRLLVSIFHNITFMHIYEEQNQVADLLSKRGINTEMSKFFFVACVQDALMNIRSISFS